MKIYKSIGILGVSSLLFGMVLFFPGVSSAATLYRQLQLGMSGSDVSDIQIFLAKDTSIYPQGLVTGYFGQLTKAAVERFQTNRGIVTSGTPSTTGYGRVGPQTLARINSEMGGSSVGTNVYPVIGPLTISSSTNNAVTISWNTTNNTSAVLYYSSSPITMVEASATSGVIIGGSSLLVNSDFTSAHNANLTGLSPNTTYNYVVYTRDAMGRENVTWPASFRTNQ